MFYGALLMLSLVLLRYRWRVTDVLDRVSVSSMEVEVPASLEPPRFTRFAMSTASEP